MFLLRLLLIEQLLVTADDYSSYYNDVDSEYDNGEQTELPQNETILDEVIIFGNDSLDLSDLATYQIVNNHQLPDLQPVRYLFSLSRLFINAVWEPFVEIEDFLFSLMTLQESEQIDYVSDNWKQVSFNVWGTD